MLRVQAKETKKIPQPLLDRVIHECVAFNVKRAADVDRRKVLRILKRIKQTKWNDHATKITFLINGIRPIQFTDAQQSILVNMFNDLLPSWHKHVDKKRRSNFCSYGYTLYKLCQMKGWNEFLPYFPLLRGKVKLAQTDILWRTMMDELGWPFQNHGMYLSTSQCTAYVKTTADAQKATNRASMARDPAALAPAHERKRGF